MANQSISQRPAASTLKDNDLLVVSQKQANGSYLTCKVTADKLKGASAYQQWFNYNLSATTYLNAQSIYRLYNSSSYNSVNSFATATNLMNASNQVYNNWVQSSNDVQEIYITENNLHQAFDDFMEQNANTFIDFLVSQNLVNNYNTWLANNQAVLLPLFMQINTALIAYESYLLTHQDATAEQFLAAIGASDEFNQWVEQRVVKLTEDAFNRMLAGKNGKTATVSKYEKFWISICGVYTPPVEQS